MGAPTRLGLTAVLAGALWPVLAVGLLPATMRLSGRAHPAADATPADAAQQSSEASERALEIAS